MDETDTLVDVGKFSSSADAIRETSRIGCKVIRYQEMMKDPKQATEFARKMQEAVHQDKIFEWAATLTENQIDGFMMALEMEKEGRYKIQPLQ